MTEIQKQHGPFAVSTCGPKNIAFVIDAGSRINLVRESTDYEWLTAVIKDRDVQSTVRLAAERRRRWVNKACKNLLKKYREQNRT